MADDDAGPGGAPCPDDEALARQARELCTECALCEPCPNGVAIVANMRFLILCRVYGRADEARRLYAAMPRTREEAEGPDGLYAGACRECRECEAKCPERSPVMWRLKQVHATLVVLDEEPDEQGP
jgi:uncharacterized protein